MLLENFSKEILNKDIPPYLTKLIIYSLANKEYDFDINNICSLMFISNQKLINEIKKTKNIDGFLKIIATECSYEITVLEKNISLSIKKKNKKKTSSSSDKNKGVNPYLNELFVIWCNVMDKTSRTNLDAKRKAVLEKALNQYAFEKSKKAIIGCSKSLWHRGYNNRDNPTEYTKKEYNSLELIFRNEDNVDKFVLLYDEPTIEEQLVKLKTKPNSINSMIENDEWANERLNNFQYLEEAKNIENKNNYQETPKLIDNKKSSLPRCLYDLAKGSEDFLLTGVIFRDNHLVDVEVIDAEFEEIIDNTQLNNVNEIILQDDIIDAEIEEVDSDDDVPMYLKILQNKKD